MEPRAAGETLTIDVEVYLTEAEINDLGKQLALRELELEKAEIELKTTIKDGKDKLRKLRNLVLDDSRTIERGYNLERVKVYKVIDEESHSIVYHDVRTSAPVKRERLPEGEAAYLDFGNEPHGDISE